MNRDRVRVGMEVLAEEWTRDHRLEEAISRLGLGRPAEEAEEWTRDHRLEEGTHVPVRILGVARRWRGKPNVVRVQDEEGCAWEVNVAWLEEVE